ncbi:MAG: hypothetical protein AAB593_01450, partial [Patescibacteria group bacterium]
ESSKAKTPTIERVQTETIETPEGKEKAKGFIKRRLEGALEKGAFGGIGLDSFLIWLIQKGGEQARKYAMSELKGSWKAISNIS